MKKIAAIIVMLLLYTAYDTVSQGTSVTVFSAKGEKFILEVNGTRQNAEPQSKVYAEGIGGPMVKMKVFFEEPGISPISKSAMNKVNGEFIFVIDKDSKGKYILQSSATDWSSKAEGGEQEAKSATTGKTEKQEKVEKEKVEKENVKAEKTGKSERCESPISEPDFYSSTAAISSAPFDPPKLSHAKNLSRTKCLSAEQVRQVIYIFDGEKTKLDFAKYAYEYVYDPENYEDVFESLRERSVQELKRYIETKK